MLDESRCSQQGSHREGHIVGVNRDIKIANRALIIIGEVKDELCQGNTERIGEEAVKVMKSPNSLITVCRSR